MPTTLLLTAVAMIAFAANSLLARAALGHGAIDAVGFTSIRLVTGAIALGLLVASRGGPRTRPGSWPSALALLAYALAFSLAYLRLGAATGALILFAAVQGSMLLIGIARGDHPTLREWLGLGIAFAAFVYLLLPGLDRPDPVGSLLMVISGGSWGIYTLRGRGKSNPLAETAGNFVRAALPCLPLLAWAAWRGHATAEGLLLATVSGVVTSGLGYAVWYRALPRLKTTQAATVQLTVPLIATAGGLLLLGEALPLRLALSGVALLGGVALAILSRR
jgi:drug/metabolite transporter (DMT)-like permease